MGRALTPPSPYLQHCVWAVQERRFQGQPAFYSLAEPKGLPTKLKTEADAGKAKQVANIQ